MTQPTAATNPYASPLAVDSTPPPVGSKVDAITLSVVLLVFLLSISPLLYIASFFVLALFGKVAVDF
jgi:hypothetical protein